MTETIDDLIELDMKKGETITEWCKRRNFPRRTLGRMRLTDRPPTRGTIVAFAIAIRGIGGKLEERIERVEAALA